MTIGSSTASEPRLQQRKSQQRGLRPTQAPYNVPIRNGTAKQDRGIRLHPASSAMALTEARNARNPVPFSNEVSSGRARTIQQEAFRHNILTTIKWIEDKAQQERRSPTRRQSKRVKSTQNSELSHRRDNHPHRGETMQYINESNDDTDSKARNSTDDSSKAIDWPTKQRKNEQQLSQPRPAKMNQPRPAKMSQPRPAKISQPRQAKTSQPRPAKMIQPRPCKR
ncbi:hypothetical protein niasHT_014903 [Heterodera trifolii]|uniref:Uncharacterized protein n=1 Tax=Heterodera trifolii TaxID=157864 RepID=A0ABD2LFJ7_9BILA